MPLFLQGKFIVSHPGDAYEVEADRVADRVTRMPAPVGQRKADVASAATSAAGTPLADLGPGVPLELTTRSFFEPRFGADFGSVRVHSGAAAARSARAMRSHAYTVGHDVVFAEGRWAPATSEGAGLLAHELAHVVQNSRSATLDGPAVRRRPIPDSATPETFTVVSTTKLNEDGRFTGPLLDFISQTWTRKSVGSPAELAQQIVDALELSGEFLAIAKSLDAYLSKHPDLEIWVAYSGAGTSFIPAGTPFQDPSGGPVRIPGLTSPGNVHFISIDFAKAELAFHSGATGPQQIASFVQNLVHEATHAYNLVNRIGTSGLTGALQEEQRTRKTELKALEEIRAATKDADVGTELAARIAQTKAAGLTLGEIAANLTSEGTATYLESYYLGAAINSLTSQRSAALKKIEGAGLTGFSGLAPIEDLSDFDFMIYNANATFIINANARGFSTERDKSGAKLPITDARRRMLLKLLGGSLTLKQVTDVDDKGWNDAEKLMLLHVQLIHAYRIKGLVAKEWLAFAASAAAPAISTVADSNAAKYLGRPSAYAALRAPAKRPRR